MQENQREKFILCKFRWFPTIFCNLANPNYVNISKQHYATGVHNIIPSRETASDETLKQRGGETWNFETAPQVR